jgi:hypothetical protein
MLSPEALERYRRMSLSERLALVLELIREETPHLLAGPPEVVDRRFELLRRENDLRNEGILAGLARAKSQDERSHQSD